MKRIYILAFLSVLMINVYAQKITLNGTIFSFKGDKVMLLKKAQKNVSFDGSLEGVKIELAGTSNNATVTTGLGGNFSIPLEGPGDFTLRISRSGYTTIEAAISYKESSPKQRYESLFFILKQGDNDQVKIGTVAIDPNGLSYQPADSKSKSDVFESNAHLLEKAVQINKTGGGPIITNKSNLPTNDPKKVEKVVVEKLVADTSAKNSTSSAAIAEVLKFNGNESVDDLKSKLDEAKKMLATLSPDSQEYILLKQQIEMAEQKIKDKEAIIQYQENEIAFANKVIIYLVLVIVFALGAAGAIFYFFKQKKRYAEILKEKNANIMRINNRLMSSIRYASLIQTGFLQDKSQMGKLFSDAFVFNQPKDILSGDFYWFAHKNGYRIVVVADCTGHGVPGAMLTVLGHNILEETINVQGETIPSKILVALNKGLVKTFGDNKHNLEFGMDLTIVSMKDNSDEIVISGVNNGLYYHNGSKLEYIAVPPISLGIDFNEKEIKEHKLSVKKGDSLYMFTDGFADQFGMDKGKKMKYNVKRMEKTFGEIAGSNNFKSAESSLEKTLNNWKGELDQLDDVCIVGVRI